MQLDSTEISRIFSDARDRVILNNESVEQSLIKADEEWKALLSRVTGASWSEYTLSSEQAP